MLHSPILDNLRREEHSHESRVKDLESKVRGKEGEVKHVQQEVDRKKQELSVLELDLHKEHSGLIELKRRIDEEERKEAALEKEARVHPAGH